ncbi:MAG: hypothetical protein R3Y09_13225 [Clostridia bacterium]
MNRQLTEYQTWWQILKGNYAKGVHKLRTILRNETYADLFLKEFTALSIIFDFDIDNPDGNNEDLLRLLETVENSNLVYSRFTLSKHDIDVDTLSADVIYTEENQVILFNDSQFVNYITENVTIFYSEFASLMFYQLTGATKYIESFDVLINDDDFVTASTSSSSKFLEFARTLTEQQVELVLTSRIGDILKSHQETVTGVTAATATLNWSMGVILLSAQAANGSYLGYTITDNATGDKEIYWLVRNHQKELNEIYEDIKLDYNYQQTFIYIDLSKLDT